ncbi:MAG: SPOR domain-containing protein [Alphaproteobacteria bacterium]|nr:SPOR domain-containing protein [Alphaproteobacteria bacterium]
MAIAAHTNDNTPAGVQPKMISARYEPVSIKRNAPWSIQIGAFTSRASSDRAVRNVLNKLPAPYSKAQPVIAPLKTADGWLYRGRLTGFTKDEALAACNFVSDCLPVAPQN